MITGSAHAVTHANREADPERLHQFGSRTRDVGPVGDDRRGAPSVAQLINRNHMHAIREGINHLVPATGMKAGRVEQQDRRPIARLAPFEITDVAMRRREMMFGGIGHILIPLALSLSQGDYR